MIGPTRLARTPKAFALGALLFAMIGLLAEVAFTGLGAGASGSFRGHVSLLMIPVYVFAYLLAGPVQSLFDLLGWRSAALRIPFIILVIYGIEWSFGAFYQSIGLRPWHYDHGWASEFSNGNITLYWLPVWTVFALCVYPVVRAVDAVIPRVTHAAPPVPASLGA